jgi:putative PIN family toxin of toxin-antitoxin system
MRTAVFDTNIIVSGIISPSGPPGRILDGILDGLYQPVISDAILAEYTEVLTRSKFDFSARKITQVLDALCIQSVSPPFHPFPQFSALPDPDDAIFIEAAIALNVPIITGNKRHYPSYLMGAIKVLSPIDFLSEVI